MACNNQSLPIRWWTADAQPDLEDRIWLGTVFLMKPLILAAQMSLRVNRQIGRPMVSNLLVWDRFADTGVGCHALTRQAAGQRNPPRLTL
jgi:hypothetical protein